MSEPHDGIRDEYSNLWRCVDHLSEWMDSWPEDYMGAEPYLIYHQSVIYAFDRTPELTAKGQSQ